MNIDMMSQDYYPINKLRNIALNSSFTDYILTIDADFIPSKHLEAAVQSQIRAGFFDDVNATVRAILVHSTYTTYIHVAMHQFPPNWKLCFSTDR